MDKLVTAQKQPVLVLEIHLNPQAEFSKLLRETGTEAEGIRSNFLKEQRWRSNLTDRH